MALAPVGGSLGLFVYIWADAMRNPRDEIDIPILDFNPLEPVLTDLLAYWRSKKRFGHSPKRSEIDPIEIPALLPQVGLIDVEASPRRFRYRLIGTFMNTVFGNNLTGAYLDEGKEGPYAEFLQDLYSQAVDENRPILNESQFSYTGGRQLQIRRLILPLMHEAEPRVSMLLFANAFRTGTGDVLTPPRLALLMPEPFKARDINAIIDRRTLMPIEGAAAG